MNKSLYWITGTWVILLWVTACHSHGTSGNLAVEKADTEKVGTVAPETNAANEEALRQASLNGQTEEVARLLNAGTDVNASDDEGHTALMFASFNGHSSIVLDLIDKGARLDRKDVVGRTALLYASTGPFPETVKILLDHGAEPNLADSGEHFTPLMHAAAEGQMEVVRILLDYGADPSLRDVDGDDAEHFARQAGYLEVAEALHELK
jgi:ankyrin repeat protein